MLVAILLLKLSQALFKYSFVRGSHNQMLKSVEYIPGRFLGLACYLTKLRYKEQPAMLKHGLVHMP